MLVRKPVTVYSCVISNSIARHPEVDWITEYPDVARRVKEAIRGPSGGAKVVRGELHAAVSRETSEVHHTCERIMHVCLVDFSSGPQEGVAMASDTARARHAGSLEAAMVARRYYLQRKQKNEIAEEMGISRFKVARLLDEAHDAGIVHIHVDLPTDVDLELSERIAQRFNIRNVIAVRILDQDDDSLLPVIGAAAADYLAGVLSSRDVLGISWGRALTNTVDAFRVQTGSDVVQLVGGVNAGSAAIGGVELVRRFSIMTGGRAYPLNAPLLLGSAEIASALRADASLAATIARFPLMTVAAVGVGSWQPANSAVAGELSARERAEAASLGVVADMCGILLDAEGREVDSPLRGRTIGAGLEELRKVQDVVVVAGGTSKATAIAAALRSGVVNTLITDAGTAQRMLTD